MLLEDKEDKGAQQLQWRLKYLTLSLWKLINWWETYLSTYIYLCNYKHVGQERKKACSNKKLEICRQHLLKMTSIIMFSVLFKVPIFLKETRKDNIRLIDCICLDERVCFAFLLCTYVEQGHLKHWHFSICCCIMHTMSFVRH